MRYVIIIFRPTCADILLALVPCTKRANYTYENTADWCLWDKDGDLHTFACAEGVCNRRSIEEGNREGRHHHPPCYHKNPFEEAIALPRVFGSIGSLATTGSEEDEHSVP
jgi:hypothetical protein